MNLSELARRLKVSPNELKENLPKLGFDVGRKAIKIDDRVATKILRSYSTAMREIEKREKEEQKQAAIQQAVAAAGVVELPAELTVRELASTLGISVPLLMTELLKNGILSSLNERLDFATAAVVAEDLGFAVSQKADGGSGEGTAAAAEKLKTALEGVTTTSRPPVVVVMGHVDHGKTTLLDAIRQTDVAARESGGITQHIGAYQVHRGGKLITFIDTPGHEAFRTMRSRGAKVADIAVLVVAADDGLKPQTHEALTIIKGAGLPFIVAINKIDKPDADIERVKQQLGASGLSPEDWGGDTICVPLSAKSGEGLDKLLEMILLVADVQAERIVADTSARALGTVIEAHVDPGEGPVATLLVQNGTLRENDFLIHGDVQIGKARVLKNYKGETVTEAAPAMPVRILGLKDAPEVGDVLETGDPAESYRTTKKRKMRRRSGDVTVAGPHDENEQATILIPLMLKADVLGSLEALIESIDKLGTPEVRAQVIGRGLGHITEADVERAAATSETYIAGFRVQVTREALDRANELSVEVKTFDVIYALLDDLKARLSIKLTPTIVHTDLGTGIVLKLFRQEAKRQVVGVRVATGLARAGADVVILRNGSEIGRGVAAKLQAGKEAINEAASGSECGMEITGAPKLAPGDEFAFFTETEERRTI